MRLYEFSRDYLREQTEKYFPDIAPELSRYYTPNLYSYQPFFTAIPGQETLSDVMKLFAFILQNRFNLPNVINFKKNYNTIKRVTNNFDVIYLCTETTSQSLYEEFERRVGFVKGQHTWKLYCEGLIGAANYLRYFSSFEDFKDYLDKWDLDSIVRGLCQIPGLGKVMARNFLKELGFTSLGKPDVHLLEVFKALGLPCATPEEFDETLRRVSAEESITPYILDRTIWLICSGKYFLHDKVIDGGKYFLRKRFIKHIKESIESQ